MKKTIALIIAIFAITVLSCDKKTMPESGFPYTDHFVDVYTYMTRLNVGWPHVVEQDGFAHGDFVFNISIGWDAEIRGDELDAIHKQLGDNSRIRPGNRFSPRIATLNHFIKFFVNFRLNTAWIVFLPVHLNVAAKRKPTETVFCISALKTEEFESVRVKPNIELIATYPAHASYDKVPPFVDDYKHIYA